MVLHISWHTHTQCGSYLGHQTKRRNGAALGVVPLRSCVAFFAWQHPGCPFVKLRCVLRLAAPWGSTLLVASLVPTYCRPTDLRITVCQHNNDTVRQGQGCPPHQKGVVVAVKGKPQTKWKRTWTPLTTNNLTTNNHHRNVPSQNW